MANYQMRYLTIGIHYPKKNCSDKILEVAEKVSKSAQSLKGNIEAGAWLDKENDRIIMLSLWENAQLAGGASKNLKPIIAGAPLSEWERKPSDNMVNLERVI